jgi:phospho-N-acetylmuramoyl-pentapeptide-transferase
MLYHLGLQLREFFFAFNVFKYITFRSLMAILIAFLLTLLLSPKVIKKLKSFQKKGYVREYTPESHYEKRHTPTMGGILINITLILTTLLLMRYDTSFLWIAVLSILSFSLIGFVDDYNKIKRGKGISIKSKLFWQVLFATLISVYIYLLPQVDTVLYFPLFKELSLDLGIFYIPFAVFVIVGSANAVNISDGLDGLAIGSVMSTAVALGIIAYATGHSRIAEYLGIPHVPLAGELSIVCFSIVGAGLGFLWFNSFPAQMFMGDVGSMGLGAALGTVALLTKAEILLAIAGGVLVFETVSVILQIIAVRFFNRRVFKLAPFHHHLEKEGLPEPKIVVRMWIVSILLAIISLSMLKLR